jgi:uncharacterized protein YecE (DUF72 family)
VILVGTSGFSFEDWTGVFYPSYLKKSDWFAWYVRRFPALEVNSTYYRIPARSLFERWDRLAPPSYPFIVKLHADATHRRHDPRPSTDQLARAVEPLRASGKLAGYLAQFPWSFREGDEGRRYLRTLRSLLPGDDALFVEFRHESWDTPGTYEFLRREGIGFSAVDEPRLPGLMPPVSLDTNGVGYVRLHGRNAVAWWSGGEAGDRYDYLYSDEELGEWVERIRELDGKTGRAFVFFNNCYAGQAVRGARRMQELLGIPLAGGEAPTLEL